MEEHQDVIHSPGPLDGSLYAKVNRNKRGEHDDKRKHDDCAAFTWPGPTTERPTHLPTTPDSKKLQISLKTSPNPNVIVLNGNKIIYVPQTAPPSVSLEQGASYPTFSGGDNPYLSISPTTKHFSSSMSNVSSSILTSSQVTRIELSDDLTKPKVLVKTVEYSPKSKGPEVKVGNMADDDIQRTASRIVSDVIKNGEEVVVKKRNDVINKPLVTISRISGGSSCSATTLSSTETDDGEIHEELSDHDSSSESSSDEEQNITISALPLKENPSTEPPGEHPIANNLEKVDTSKSDPVENKPPEQPQTSSADETPKEDSADSKPKGGGWDLPSPPPVPVHSGSGTQGTEDNSGGVMHNGGIFRGNYDKGPDYAVPMRDMKITTIPSKRAVLVSAESDDGIGHETMTTTQQTSGNDRDSFYDEGNMSYTGAGYATIDQYATTSEGKDEARAAGSDIADLPEDVQALLNGLQDGPVNSDIDSGFHGSAAALPQGKGDHAKVTSQSSSEFSDPYLSPSSSMPNTNNNATPSYEGKSYFTERVIPHNGSEAQHARYLHSPVATHNAHVPMVGTEVYYPDQHSQQKSARKKLPSVTMSTQTIPEPQEARVEIITMRNVYDKDMIQPAHAQQSFASRNDRPEQVLSPIGSTATSSELPLKQGAFVASPEEQLFDEEEEQMERENMINVEEQIRHTQQHLMFLQEQQEKLARRKIDRTRFRESMKRNSSAFEQYSQGYQFTLPVSSTLPRQPHRPTEERNTSFHGMPTNNKSQENMSPVATSNQNRMGGTTVQQGQPTDVWQPHGRKLGRQASDTSYDRQKQIGLTKSQTVDTEPVKDSNDVIMASTDLQEQLAELDRCIAQLTGSLDVPDAQDGSSAPQVSNQRRSFTLDIERKMNPNVPDGKENALVVPRPPTRSRSSFDSYKRLSQEFDVNMKRRSLNEPDTSVSDDVFSPPPQVPRKKKHQPFPPQTSHTRRQHFAPAPPPKRRLSLEERLSPQLMQALANNPGAKPKEDIHSYKEDLEPAIVPTTPSFPNSPSTPYVNSESPERAKSPPGLMKTPLSMLHLKPTESPTETLHHHEGDLKSSPANGETMPNGHVKETALLSDGGRRHQGLEARNSSQREEAQQRMSNGQNHRIEYSGRSAGNEFAVHTNVISVQRDIKPVHSTPQQSEPSLPMSHLHSRLPSEHTGMPLPPQYQHNNSGASHSSHSPAATSSNSRRGSSDSLDGPSTRHSNSSLLSSSSSASSPHSGLPAASPNSIVSPISMARPGSQLSSYDRNFHMPGTRSGDESLGSPQSGRTSSSSISDVDRMNSEMSQATVSKAPKFIRDTTSFWYKPDITRDQALALLRDKAAGCFVVRDSRCFPGAFGLALKVDKLPPTVQARPGVDVTNEYVRHFLIEPSSRGVKLKGCPNEPVFGSLSALVYQHSITPLALPCKLLIPTTDLEVTPPPGTLPRSSQPDVAANSAAELLKQGAACNVIYIGSVDTESLTGPQAIERAIRETYKTAQTNSNKTSIVHFKVSPQGITLTDNARKIFFRRHYPTASVTYCGLDPLGNTTKVQKARRWDATGVHGSPDAWLFGFVARKQAGSSDNTCHVFAELDPAQPARAIVNFVSKVLIGTSRQNHP